MKAHSPRDGGWVRMHFFYDFFLNEEDGWKAVAAFWPVIVLTGDCTSVDVVKTIRFKPGDPVASMRGRLLQQNQ